MSIIIKNYAAKKARNRTRITLVPDSSPPRVLVEVHQFDDETETRNWVTVGETNTRHLNTILQEKQNSRVALTAAYNQQKAAIDQEIIDINDMKADVIILAPLTAP